MATAAVGAAGADLDKASERKSVVLIGDSNTWYWDRPVAAHRAMEHVLKGIPFLNKEWLNAKVYNLAISGTRPRDWIVEKECVEGGKGKRYPINSHCDEIEFLAQGITRVVPKPDIVIVNLGVNAFRKESPEETVDQLAALKEYLEKEVTPRVILAAPFSMPKGSPRRKFVESVRQEMADRGLLDWEFPQLEFEGRNTGIHLTERSRAMHGALMGIWLVYGSPSFEVGKKQPSVAALLDAARPKNRGKRSQPGNRKKPGNQKKPDPKASGAPAAGVAGAVDPTAK